MAPRKAKASGQNGQSIVLFALMIFVFIGFLSLALDVGHAYAERRFMQNGADSGALAAGAMLSGAAMPCNPSKFSATDPNTARCVNNVIYMLTEQQVFQRAAEEVNANVSPFGYNAAPTITVEYAKWGNATTFYPVNPASALYMPGDAYKVRVTARADWQTWFHLVPDASTPAADDLTRGDMAAAARAVVRIAGVNAGEAVGPTWPMVRRRSAVSPSDQSPGVPYTFWSSGIAHSEDQAGSAWKSVVNFGLYSIRRDTTDSAMSYSHSSNPRVQAFDSAKNFATTSNWTPRFDMTCNAPGGAPMSCGTQWSPQGNSWTSATSPAIGRYPQDPQNWFYYGYQGTLSVTNDWYNKSCRPSTVYSASATNDCQVPTQAQLNTFSQYNLPIPPADFGSPQWPGAGDWVETYDGGVYGGGNVGDNIFGELQAFIHNNGTHCAFSDRTYTQGQSSVPWGNCVTVAVYLWEGGQLYDKSANTWEPWTGAGGSSPDRVHLVDWWYFSFYENLVDGLSSSEIEGFFVAKGVGGVPPGGGGAPSGKLNYYYMVGE